VKADMPNIPLALIEGYKALKDLVVPKEVDWVGMDFYGAMVFDAQWAPIYGSVDYQKEALASFVENCWIVWLDASCGRRKCEDRQGCNQKVGFASTDA
jgi:hypothetical protein